MKLLKSPLQMFPLKEDFFSSVCDDGEMSTELMYGEMSDIEGFMA